MPDPTPLERLQVAYNVPGLRGIPAAAAAHDLIADTLCAPTTVAVMGPIVAASPAKMMDLLKVVNAETKQRVSHLCQINRILPAAQQVVAMLPKKSTTSDHDLIMSIRGMDPSYRIGLDTFFGKATAGRALVNLRTYVQSNGFEFRNAELRQALRIVSMVGSKRDDALSRDLMQVWMAAFNAHGPASDTMPDCSMTPAVLKEHYEKHCCNMHGNNRGEEPYWWANTLRYSITKADLAAVGINLDKFDMQRIFPQNDKITGSDGSKHLFNNFATPALAARLYGLHGTKYHDHIKSEFKKASKAFVSFHGKIQVAARKGLFFYMASYEGGVLQLKSSYSPDNLEAHWTRNQADRVWDIRA